MATAADCETSCGTLPSGVCVAEDASIRVTSFDATYSRDKVEFFNSEGCVNAVRYRNPTASLSLEAELINRNTGLLGNMHVGDEVGDTAVLTAGSLNNYTGTIRGFDTTLGCIMLDEVQDSCTEDAAPTTSFSFTHYPQAA